MFTYVTTIFISIIALVYAHLVSAAVMYIVPESGNFNLKEEMSIDIKINSEEESINAAQATLRWPANVLEFIGVSKESSSFNFWVEEPIVSPDGNSLNFIGGTAKGISGSALQILKMRFRTQGAGAAEISLSDAAITASDGKGTNVLSKIKGASLRVGGEVVEPKAPESVSLPEIIPQPVRVERKAIPASQLPQKPVMKIPLYSDETKWHNYFGGVIAFWEVPDDVVSMATALDHSPNTVAQKREELATGKSFGVLEDGIWYVHVRFSNNIGWGPAAHYRLAIDTKPPLAFELAVLEGETTDNPAPTLQFKTSDALSGLIAYYVTIDGDEAIRIPVTEFTGEFTLPLQTPGTHEIVVRAVDTANNSIEDSVALEILPIPLPAITFVDKELFSGEEKGLTVKGIALPNINVLLHVRQLLRQGKGEVVAQKTAHSDEKGNWEFTFDEPMRNGTFIVTVQGQDNRGALSMVVESSEVRVKAKPILQIGFLQLGKGGAALFLLIILITGFGGGVWFYKKRQGKLAMRVLFAESEITKIFQLIRTDADRIAKARETSTASDDEYAIKRLQKDIQQMEMYLKTGVEKIKKSM